MRVLKRRRKRGEWEALPPIAQYMFYLIGIKNILWFDFSSFNSFIAWFCKRTILCVLFLDFGKTAMSFMCFCEYASVVFLIHCMLQKKIILNKI